MSGIILWRRSPFHRNPFNQRRLIVWPCFSRNLRSPLIIKIPASVVVGAILLTLSIVLPFPFLASFSSIHLSSVLAFPVPSLPFLFFLLPIPHRRRAVTVLATYSSPKSVAPHLLQSSNCTRSFACPRACSQCCSCARSSAHGGCRVSDCTDGTVVCLPGVLVPSVVPSFFSWAGASPVAPCGHLFLVGWWHSHSPAYLAQYPPHRML